MRLLTAAGDQQRAAEVLLSAEDALLEQGAAATYLRLADQLDQAIVRADPRLPVSMAGAAAQSGQLERVPALLDIAEARLHGHSPSYPAWRSLAAPPRFCGPRTTRGPAPIRPQCWRRPSVRSVWRPIRPCRAMSSPGSRSAPCCRRAALAARRGGGLVEELTDRELSLLRALQGPLSQREIGAELYLSLNTIKGYTKSLYRKLGAASRAEAVERGRELGLI